MALNFFLLALLVTYSAQGSDAKSTTYAEEYGLIDVIQKLVQEAIELVKQTVDAIKLIVQQLYESLQDVAADEIKKAIEKVEKLRDEALEALKKLVGEAEGLGQEALSCVEAKKGDILNVVHEAQESTVSCVITVEREVKNVVVNVKNVVSQSVNKVKDLLARFSACDGILCKVGVVSEAIGAVTNIKENVITAVEEARETVKVEIPKFVKCTSAVAETFKSQTKSITEEIVGCMDKIE